MSTTKRKLKAKIKTEHPALAFMRAEHESYPRKKGVGSCFHSDFEHDQRLLNGDAEKPGYAARDNFGWILSPHATYLKRGCCADQALSDLIRERVAVINSWPVMVADCYAVETDVRFFFWDGTALWRARDAQHLQALMLDACRKLAIAELQRRRTPIAEEFAYAGPGENIWRTRLTGELAELDSQITQIERELQESAS